MVLHWDVSQRGPRHHGIVPLTSTSCPKPSPSRVPKEAADEGPSNPGRRGDIAHLGWWHRAPPRTSSTSSDSGYLQPCFGVFFLFWFSFLKYGVAFQPAPVFLLFPCLVQFVFPCLLCLLANSGQRTASSVGPLNYSEPFETKDKYLSSLKMFA